MSVTNELVSVLDAYATDLEIQCQAAAPQAAGCEQALLRDLGDIGKQLALDGATRMTDAVQTYLACRLGGLAPQAWAAGETQALLDNVGPIIRDCALGQWKILLTSGWQAFAAAVARCAIGKLLGGGLGGILTPAPSAGPELRAQRRCGS